MEKASWRTDDLIRLVETMQELKASDSNYSALLRKLKGKESCEQEGIPFLEIIGMYRKVGCRVTIPTETKKQVSPDICIFSPVTQDNFYIEVSRLGENEERALLDQNYRQLLGVFDFDKYQLPYSCTQFRYITNNEMPGVLANIRDLKERAVRDENVIFFEDDKIRLAVAHPSKFDQLEKWIDVHDYRKGLHGPPLDFDETYRICNNKIRKKAKQIPPEKSGLIYIPLNSLFFWVWDPVQSIMAIERQLAHYPNVYGVVMYAHLIHNVEPVTIKESGHFYSIKKMNETVIRYLLFVQNKKYKGSLSKETLDLMHQSFE
jgi:hypothetical protein